MVNLCHQDNFRNKYKILIKMEYVRDTAIQHVNLVNHDSKILAIWNPEDVKN